MRAGAVAWLGCGFLLAACSIWQSPSRKFLEQQAFEYAGVSVSANKTGCQAGASNEGWILLSKGNLANVYEFESQDFELRVVPTADAAFSCDFRFSSAQEMYEKMPDAIDHTITALGPGRQ